MATANFNAVKYGVIGGQGFKQLHQPVASASPVKQGELVYLDTTAHLAKPLDSDAHAATLLGVALQPSVVTSNLDNGSGVGAENSIMVGWDVVADFKSTAAETYYQGDALYLGADAQTVTKTVGANTHIVGTVVLPKGVASVVGATGVMVGMAVKSAIY